MSNVLNKINSFLFSSEKFLEKIKYNNDGYYIHQKQKSKYYMLSVVLPTYNASQTIEKTIDSIIKQSIGFENIELLIIDDFSEDNTRLIILEYAKLYPNITPVFLEENSGSPSLPRNLGIDLATGRYLTFIDSDDWLHKKGLETLYNLLVRTGDKYAVGKTIKVTDSGQYIIGEYNSWGTRESINPFSIPHIFQHLGPTGRMMETEFVKNNNFRFPYMRFAEDKQFFIDVLTKCGTISTSDEVIYYANRLKNNKSFTTKTTIFEKTDANIALIKYVKNKNLPLSNEKMVLNRLYEFDCITRLFDRKHFLRSTDKNKYYAKFKEVLSTTESLNYDFTDNFHHPWHKILVELFKEGRYDDLVKLIKWSKNEPIKDFYLKNGLPYYRLPFKDKKGARIKMLALFDERIKKKDKLIIRVQIYGDNLNDINSLVVCERNNELIQIDFPVKKIDKNLYEIELYYQEIDSLNTTKYAIFIRYLNYMKTPIKMNVRNLINYNEKKLDFYITVADNMGLNIN